MTITAQELRNIVGDIIEKTIDIRRGSKNSLDEDYNSEFGYPNEDEIDEFVYHNPLLELDEVEGLLDPGLLGYSATTVNVDSEWLNELKRKTKDWSENNSWLGGDEPFLVSIDKVNPDETDLWENSSNIITPNWAEKSPLYILLALDLLKQGKFLTELNWRDFEKLIGDLLENEGWKIQVTQPTRDGGIDVIAERNEPILGKVKSVWQAKKYGISNKVKLREVRELSAIRDSAMATKGIIITTSHLTKDAIEWIKRDVYRLGYKDKSHLETWLQKYM